MTKPAEKDPNRALKMVVISMGLLLIGGTILLFVLAFKKMAGGMPEDAQQASIPREYRDCGEHRLSLPDGFALEAVKFDGTIARLAVANEDGEWMIILADSCSGKKLGQLHITPAQK